MGHCYSVPALSGVRGLNSELKKNNQCLPLSPYSQTPYRWIKTVSISTNTQIIYKNTPTLWQAAFTFSLYVLNTSVSAADSLDSSVHQRADSLLNLVGHCYSVPALSGVRGLNSELKTNNHSLPVTIQPDNLQMDQNSLNIYKHTDHLQKHINIMTS